MLRTVEWLVAVAMLFQVFYALITGRITVKGAGLYQRADNARGYWFMVGTHLVAGALFAWMAWMGIPPP